MSTKLNILVPVKRVIDFAIKPRINKAGSGIEKAGVKFSINPFCDIAVEESIRIRETNKSFVDKIHAVSIGPSKAQDILRSSLAKGIDSATLVDAKEEEIEPLAVAKVLKKIVESKGSNLVILGKQAIDDDSNHTGQMLAGLLNWPQVTNAAKVTVNGSGDSVTSVTVVREIDGGEETLEAELPLIITADLRLNEPRFASLPNIMKAKKKPLEKLSLEKDFGELDLKQRLKVLKVEEPKEREAGVKVKNVDELIAKLKDLKAI
ncbi:hypothetical protein WICMUC_004811 [Wickerhamomyces mucosus]|uniref:Probable electron transfer flavoprotein subunit beta n=1 Tax=Wickerhamomyces mucosus TaxID=1378264 RepID=A0A9P8PGI2_9ASCO|nr:hypothetical protein WICMUC_004811 [Wickerhamomyces mucosus]